MRVSKRHRRQVQSYSLHWGEAAAEPILRVDVTPGSRLSSSFALPDGLTNLLIFNQPDFERFTGIEVFTPAEILAGSMPK